MYHFTFGLAQKASRAAALGLMATLLVFLQSPISLGDDAARHKQIFEMNLGQCQGGNMVACTQVGTLYLQGKGVSKNAAKAVQYFNQACGKDKALACSNLATLYFSGSGVTRDYQAALKLSRKACDLKDADEGGNGCIIFATLLYEGHAMKKDPERVPFLLKNSCHQKNAQGCQELGALLQMSSETQGGPNQFSTYLDQACEMNLVAACDSVFMMLLLELKNSFTFETNPQNINELHGLLGRACKSGNAVGCYGQAKLSLMDSDVGYGPGLLQKACDGGLAQACYELGLHKRAHVYSNTSKADAIPYFKKACTGGDNRSCHMLGELHAEYSYTFYTAFSNKEEGIIASNQSAIAYFAAACDSGYSLSCYNLGVHYFEGVGIASDKSKAASLFQRGCKEGLEATSCYNSGYMYGSGVGVTKDTAKANRYYLLACDAGHKLGCREVGRG